MSSRSIRAVAAKAPLYDGVGLRRRSCASPPSSSDAYPGLEVIDARAGRPALAAAPAARCDRPSLRRRATTASPVRLARGDERAAGAARPPAGSSRAAARCCSGSARSPTGRSPPPVTHRRCAARSRGSPSACSTSATGGCESRRPRAGRRASRAASSATRSRTGCPVLEAAPGRGPARRSASEPPDRSSSQPGRPRPPRGRLGERHLAGRARQARPLARDAARSGRRS